MPPVPQGGHHRSPLTRQPDSSPTPPPHPSARPPPETTCRSPPALQPSLLPTPPARPGLVRRTRWSRAGPRPRPCSDRPPPQPTHGLPARHACCTRPPTPKAPPHDPLPTRTHSLHTPRPRPADHCLRKTAGNGQRNRIAKEPPPGPPPRGGQEGGIAGTISSSLNVAPGQPMHGLTLDTVMRMLGGEMQFLRSKSAGHVKRHVDGLYYMVSKVPARQCQRPSLEDTVEACECISKMAAQDCAPLHVCGR